MWSQRTAPTRLASLLGNEASGLLMNDMALSGDLLNLLLVGPVGCGKSAAVRLFLSQLFPDPRERAEMVLPIYASITRTSALTLSDTTIIDPAENIQQFIKVEPSIPATRPYKIVVVYDLECWMESNLLALRTIMENYETSCRFILLTHEITEVLEALQSRSITLMFRQPSLEQLTPYLQQVWHNLAPSTAPRPMPAHILPLLLQSRLSLRSILNQMQMIAYGAAPSQLPSQIAHWQSLPPLAAAAYLNSHLRNYRPTEVLDMLTQYLISRQEKERLREVMQHQPTFVGLMLISLRTNPSLATKISSFDLPTTSSPLSDSEP